MNYFDDATLIKIIDHHLKKAGANEAYSSQAFSVTNLLKDSALPFKLAEDLGISKKEIDSMIQEDKAATDIIVGLAGAERAEPQVAEEKLKEYKSLL